MLPPREDITPSEPDPDPATLARSTVAASAQACSDLFIRCSVFLQGYDDGGMRWDRVRDLTGKFNIWASNLGVFAALHASLDYRLRDFTDVKKLVLEQIEYMRDGLDRLINTSPISESRDPAKIVDHRHDEIDAILASLSQSLDWLLRLANMIRRVSFLHEDTRLSSSLLEDSTRQNATPMLREVFGNFVKREFRTISQELHDRLVSTMLLRHNRIMNRRSRQVKLAMHSPKPATKPAQLETPVAVGERTIPDDLTSEREASTPKVVESTTPPWAISPAPGDKAAYHQARTTQSWISKANTITMASGGKLEDIIPPPPWLAPNQHEFVCPYCCFILDANYARNHDAWSLHVKNDLDPYVCTFFPCAHGDDIIQTSAEWILHEQTHRMRWHCASKSHETQMFQSQDEFIDHISAQHPGLFNQSQLLHLAEISQRPLKRILDACPFCGEADVESGQSLEDHVARHLQYLAILSLPLYNDADEVDAKSVSSIESPIEEQMTPSQTWTIGEENEMPPATLSCDVDIPDQGSFSDFTHRAPLTIFRKKLPTFFPPPDFRRNATGIVMDLDCQVDKDNGLFNSPHRKFARKCFRFSPISNPRELENDKKKFTQELDILYNAQHRHVIELVFAYIFEPEEAATGESHATNPHGAIIMVRAKSFNDILEHASVQHDKNMTSNFFKWFGCLATTLDHIHGLGIRHRDIKPDNILVTSDDEVVLADFGISNMILGKTLSTTRQGAARDRTVMYCAPEVEGGSSRTRSADVFALGVLFLEMLSKLRPGGRSDLQTALTGDDSDSGNDSDSGDASDSSDDSDQHKSYTKALRRIHGLIDNKWSRPDGPIWEGKEEQWYELVSMCKNMTSEDPFKRPCALDIVSEISKMDQGRLMQPCKCSKPPEEASARLLYICKHGLTDDLRLPHPLENFNETVGAIHQASARGHLTVVKALTSHGFAAELRDHSGQTALHCAAAFGKHEVVKYLLRFPQVRMDSTDRKKRTALHYAAGNGSIEVVDMLLGSVQGRRAANKKDEDKRTALHFAATRGHGKIIKKLMDSKDRKHDVNAKDKNGITALHLAAGYGSMEAVQFLLDNDANAGILDKNERAVLQYAINGIQKSDKDKDRGRYEEVIQLLLSKTRLNVCIRVACGNAGVSPCDECDSRRKMVCDFVAKRTIDSEARVELNSFIKLARPRFSTSDMKRIAHLLEHLYPRWHENGYKVERLYTILSLGGVPFRQCAEFVDKSTQKQVTDYQLPLTERSVLDILRSSRVIDRFLEEQKKVISRTIYLQEKGEHISLKHDEWSKYWDGKVDIKSIYEDRVFSVTANGRRPLVAKVMRVGKRSGSLFSSIELGVLKRVYHDHLVTTVGSFTTPTLLGIVMSPVARCNLELFLEGVHEDDNLGNSDEKMRFVANCFGCLAETLRYLHFDAHITHYDIKPRNILINGSRRRGLQILLTDFGISNDWQRWRLTTLDRPVTDVKYMYCAPEIADVNVEKKVNSNADIWSMGCVFLELATVLKGYEIADLRQNFKNRGHSQNYFTNSTSVKKWTQILSQPNGYAGSTKFEWIQDMLDTRPPATLLCDIIMEVGRAANIPLFGACCKPESTQIKELIQIRPACGLSGNTAVPERSSIAAVAWDEPEAHRMYFQKDNGLIVQAIRERRHGGSFTKQLEVVAEHAKLQSPIAATTWFRKAGLQRPTIRVYYLDAANRIRERAWDPLDEWKDGPLCRVDFRASPSSALAVTSWDNGRILLCYQTEGGDLGMLLGWATMSQWRTCEALPTNDLPRPISNTSMALVNFPIGKGRGFRLYYQVDGPDIPVKEVCWDWNSRESRGVRISCQVDDSGLPVREEYWNSSTGERVSWDIPKFPGRQFLGKYCLRPSTNAVISAIAFVRQQRLEIRVYIAGAGRLLETRFHNGEWMRPKRLLSGNGIRQLAVVHWQKYISRYCVEEGGLVEG